jgi:hypothetical protein
MRDLWTAYNDRLKFFFSLQGEYSQEDNARLGMIDSEFESFMRWFSESGNLENTVLVVFSDFGSRRDTSKLSHQGRIEERKPFMLVGLSRMSSYLFIIDSCIELMHICSKSIHICS